jgi:hypothetical protein
MPLPPDHDFHFNINNTSISSPESHEPNHSLLSPEDMCNLRAANELEEEVGGTSHDFNLRLSMNGELGGK